MNSFCTMSETANMTASSALFAGTAVLSDDLDLVHATQLRGDVSAFEQLVGRYDRKLLRIAQNVTHNPEDSEDAVQEALLEGFRTPGRLSWGMHNSRPG